MFCKIVPQILFSLILMLCVSGSNAAGGCGSNAAGGCFDVNYEITDTERLTFGEMDIFLSTESNVYNMEVDLLTHRKLIFSDGRSLKISDGAETIVLAGSARILGHVNGNAADARFGFITGFVQLNGSVILMVDANNHCLRLLDRVSHVVSDYTGNCFEDGYQDGHISKAKFYYPSSIVKDRREAGKLLITDTKNNAIRSLDMVNSQVGTVYASTLYLFWPRAISWEPAEEDSILVTTHSCINRFFLTNKTLVRLSGDEKGWWKDGSVAESVYYQTRHIAVLLPNVYIVADRYNKRLRLVDSVNDRVTSLCYGEARQGSGGSFHYQCRMNETQSLMDSPVGLLLHGNVLYTGTRKAIYSLPVGIESIHTSPDYYILQTNVSYEILSSSEIECKENEAEDRALLTMQVFVGVLAVTAAALAATTTFLLIKANIVHCKKSFSKRGSSNSDRIYEEPILRPRSRSLQSPLPKIEYQEAEEISYLESECDPNFTASAKSRTSLVEFKTSPNNLSVDYVEVFSDEF